MRRKATWMVVLALTGIGAAGYVGTARATPATGFVGTTIAVGRFDRIDVVNHAVTELATTKGSRKSLWLSWQKTKGESDLYVQNNVWQPGGSTGWHTHPGHSLITVTAGELTAYEEHGGECHQTVYKVGMGFVDPGGDHVHLIRNEGAVEARTVAVQLIPAGFARRIDAEAPAACNVF